jgi:hypothetical protein
VEEVLAAGASTSFQRLGTLITSSSNPTFISAAPNTHIPTRSGLPDNRSDLGDPDHQLLDEYWRAVMWGGTSDEPLDVHTNNPRPSATLHSASRSTQTAQNEDLDSIENSAGISELPQNNIEIASAPPVSYSPIHDQTDSQVPTSDFRRAATRERESQLIAKLNKSKSKRKIRKFPSLPSDPDLSGHLDKSFPQQTETVIPQFSVNRSLGEHHPARTKHGRISAEYDRRKAALQLLSSNTLNTQNYVPRLKCIDERGSFQFHPGAFYVADPSHYDNWKIKVLTSMINKEENPKNTLLILEGYLESDVKYFHGSNIRNPKEEEINDHDEEKGVRNKVTPKWARDIRRAKSVSIIHENVDSWIKFYEAKCAITYGELGLIGFQGKAVKTEFVLFLLQVDTISTIYVKAQGPSSLEQKSIEAKNLDILKYAAQKYQSICETFSLTSTRRQIKRVDKELKFTHSKMMTAGRVKIYIKIWMDLAIKENSQMIPSILFRDKNLEIFLPSFWEDILFYAIKYLNEDLAHVDLTKILNNSNLVPSS